MASAKMMARGVRYGRLVDIDSNTLWLMAGAFAAGTLFGRFARQTDEDKALSSGPAQEPARLLGKLSGEARADIDKLLAEKKTIPAIKRLREDTGAGLRDAKLAIDELRRGSA